MSTLSVDMIEPVGSTLTLGQSGDTVTIPVGGTFTNSGTATGFASGNTHASQWRLTTDFTGSASPIASNLEEVDAPLGFGVKGASMTEASGLFTFPSTGYWLITGVGNWHTGSSNAYLNINIYTTTNDSTYALAAEGVTNQNIYTAYASTTCSYIMDVASTSLCKCRFDIVIASGTVTTRGDTNFNETYMTFLRLADTP
jgi:hypothetical protein